MSDWQPMHEETVKYRGTLPCPYFNDGRVATYEYVVIGQRESSEFDGYLRRGYRRIGTYYYRTVCRACSACIPIRLEARRFKASRSQERTLRKNADVRLEIAVPSVNPEKTDLFVKYQRTKHGENLDANEQGLALYDMHYGFENILEMDYYLDSRLLGVGIVDVAKDALSTNYFYYDTDFLNRRPGVLSAVNEIFLAQKMGKKYYYLGYYIKENPKMSYKKFFRPNQLLRGEQWEQFAGGKTVPDPI